MTMPRAVSFSGVSDLYVYAGAGHDQLAVSGTPAGTNVYFNGGNGDDLMALGAGGGSFADLAGRVFANGQGGSDQLFLVNGAAGAFLDGVLTQGSFRAGAGPNHLYATTEIVELRTGDAGSSIDVRSINGGARILGGAGDDAVTIGGGDFNDNIFTGVNVTGGGGNDRVVIDDRNDSVAPSTQVEYRFDVAFGVDRFLKNTAGFFQGVTCGGVESREFLGSNDVNFIYVIDTQNALRIDSGGGNDNLYVTDAAGLVTFDTGSGFDAVTVNDDSHTPGDGPVTVLFDQPDDINYLDLRAGGTVRIAGGATLLKTAVPLVGPGHGLGINGTIDLAGGAMVFRQASNVPSPAVLREMITRGRNGGTWNGTSPLGAINSSAAAASVELDGVGHGLGGELAVTQSGPFFVNAADTVIGFSRQGDADMSGAVDIADFARVAANFNRPADAWTDGDYNYDGMTDIADFSAVAANFNQSATAARPPGSTVTDLFGQRVIDELI
jgi:hypothetical protein